MPDRKAQYIARIREVSRKHCEPMEDGCYYYWPEASAGCLTPFALRTIADLLDELNAPWEAQIAEYFEKEKDDADA